MVMKGETVGTGAPLPYGTAQPEVMDSGAGYYIGYRSEDGCPYSRESGYYTTYAAAKTALEVEFYGRP